MTTRVSTHRHRRLAAAALATLTMVPLAAGCGSSDDSSASSGSDSDLAALAPAASLAFVQATIDPEGDQKTAVDAVSKKLLRVDSPAAAIQKAYDSDEGSGAYAREIEPWLGDEVALAVTSAKAGSDPDIAVIAEAKDDDAQKGVDAVAKSSDKPFTKSGSYDGVDFKQGSDGLVGAVDDHVVVASTPAAFRAVVDTSKGDGLDKSADFTKATDALSGDPVGSAYFDVRRVVQLAIASDPDVAKQTDAIEQSLRDVRAAAVGLSVTETSLKLSSATLGAPAASGDPAATAAALPAGSWLAAGLGDVGQALTKGLAQFKSVAASSSGASAQQFDQGLQQFQQATGLDLQKDVLSWMGDGGLFVRGSGLTDIGGALVVTTKDPATTKRTLARVQQLVQQSGQRVAPLTGNSVDEGFSITPSGAPVEVLVAVGGDKFVVAVNRSALQEALDTTRPLSDDPAYKAAGEALGDGLKPSLFIDARTVVSLVGLAAGSDPSFQQARPYLDALTTIAAGGSRDGDVAKQTVVVGLR